MTKTNTRSRIVSILLVLIMLLSLMPSLMVPTHLLGRLRHRRRLPQLRPLPLG